MKAFAICLAVTMMLVASISRAQIDCPVIGDDPPPVTLGLEFLLCFMANEQPLNTRQQYQDIYIASLGEPATVEIICEGLNIYETIQLGSGDTATYHIPQDSARPQGALMYSREIPDQSCIYVKASKPIVCYGMNHKEYTADAFIALPRHTAGMHHMILSYTNSYLLDRPSEFAVGAWEDSTTVTIVTTAQTAGNISPGEEFKILLNQFEGVQIQAEASIFGLDLTGSIVTSDKPVAVFGGHQRAEVPVAYEPPGSQLTSRDHLAEQLPPTSTWGTRFVASSFIRGTNLVTGDLLRVLALNDSTDLSIDGTRITTLGAGKYFDTIISAPVLIETSDQALVGMYAHTATDTVRGGDPFMAIVPPVDQLYNDYTFFISSDPVYSDQHVIVVAEESAATKGIFHNGIQLPADPIFSPIPGTLGGKKFVIADLVLAAGAHRIRTNNPPEKGLTIVAYGWGNVDSYGYTAGALLKPLVGIIKGTNPKAGLPRGSAPEPKVYLRNILNDPIYFDKATISLDNTTSTHYDVQLKHNIALDIRTMYRGENKGLDLVVTPPNDVPLHGKMRVEYHTAKYRNLRPVTIPFTIEPQVTSAVGDEEGTTLAEVYITPNPVTASTTVTVDLEKAGTVSLRLLDATGREVFKQSRTSAAGTEQFWLDLRKFPAGVYTCEMVLNGGVVRKQLVVVR